MHNEKHITMRREGECARGRVLISSTHSLVVWRAVHRAQSHAILLMQICWGAADGSPPLRTFTARCACTGQLICGTCVPLHCALITAPHSPLLPAVNVVEGIELHTGLLTPEEQAQVVESVERWVGLVSRSCLMPHCLIARRCVGRVTVYGLLLPKRQAQMVESVARWVGLVSREWWRAGWAW